MDILIKSATIIDESSPHHLSKKDIYIKNGKIDKIGSSLKIEGVKTIAEKDIHVSQGWIDMNANFQDPGYEHKETLDTAIKAAASGGFTTVVISPLTNPVRDSKAQVEYLINQTNHSIITALPYGSVSQQAAGDELAELNDMKASGAIAFSDGKNSIKNPNLLQRALLYTKAFDGLVVNFPHTEEIAHQGVMNEGIVSTQLGLKGIPELAEDLMVSRDIDIVEYTDGRLHFSTVSSPHAIQQIAAAKKKGLKISCDVATYTLLLSDDALDGFDSRFKTLPPLRSKESIKGIIKAIKNGTVDALCSDHTPEDIESKKREMDHAAFGIINLQTAYSSSNTALSSHLKTEELIRLFTSGPASILGIDKPRIQEGEMADLSVFQPKAEFVFTKEQTHSLSQNSPFYGMKLQGKVLGVVNRNKAFWN